MFIIRRKAAKNSYFAERSQHKNGIQKEIESGVNVNQRKGVAENSLGDRATEINEKRDI